MKNAYLLFVGLLVCAASAWAFADEVTEVVIENANSASEILTPMNNGNSVWVKGTTDLIRLYSGSTAGVPSTSKGLKIGGGVDRTSQIKVLTTDMQNLPLTTVLPNGILSISSTSGTTDHFEKALEINGGTVNVEKDTFNLNKGGNISISSGGSITFTKKFRIGYDSGTLENPSTFTQTGGTVKINGEFLVGHYAGSVGVFNMSGGTLSVSALTLGNNGASSEKAAAKGTATFTNIVNQSFSGNVTVGNSGEGTLTLDNSSIKTSGYLYIGKVAGSSGEVTLKNGSTFSSPSHSLRIGQEGTGVVNVLSGSTLNSTGQDIHIAYSSTGDGTLTIDGGTVKANHIMVGSAGTGSLEVKNGGTITLASSKVLYVGYGAGTVGTFNMSGADSKVTVGLLHVGENTAKVDDDNKPIANVATISGGSFTSSGNILIGAEENSLGILNVEGGTVSSKIIYVGNNGTGTLEVKSGILNTNKNHIYVGNASGSNGTFNMSGGTASMGDLRVGENGTGAVNISGGTANVGLVMYAGFTGKGTINISGDANVNVTGNLNVGYNGNSTGILNVSGGTLTGSGNFNVGYSAKGTKNDDEEETIKTYGGTLAITGGAITAKGLTNIGYSPNSTGYVSIKNGSLNVTHSDNSFRIGREGTGVVEVLQDGQLFVENNETHLGYYGTGDGTLTIDGGYAQLKALQIGYASDSTGHFEIKGGKLNITGTEINVGYKGNGYATISGGEVNSTSLRVGRANGSYGELTIDGGVMNLSSAARISHEAGSEGHVFIQGNGQLNVAKELSVGYNNVGSLEVSGGKVTAAQVNIINPESSLKLSGGVINAGELTVNSGTSASLTGGTLNVGSLHNAGETTLNGTTINLNTEGYINALDGTFSATSGSVKVNPISEPISGYTHTAGDQVIVGIFNIDTVANTVNNMTSVPDGWSHNVVDFNNYKAVVAQYGSEPTGVKVWNGGEAYMSDDSSWSGQTTNKTGFVLEGTNKFKDFAGDLVILGGTNTFSINAPVTLGHLLVIDGGTTTYGSDNIEMNGTLIVNGGTFATKDDKNFFVSGTESNPAYVEVNGGTLNASRRLTIGKTGSTSSDKLTSAKLVINNGLVQCGLSNGGFYICDSDTQNVVAELEINGGALQVQNSKPSYIGSKYSKGVLTMTGGAFSTGGEVNLATRTGSTGIIDISGGTFNTTGVLNMATGTDSTGTINISGGTFTMTNTLSVATGSNSKGKINVSGGYMKVNNIKLGHAGAGEDAQLNITGGIVEITSALYGSDSSDSGNVTISGTGQMLLNSSYTSSTYAGIRELTKFEIAGTGDGSGAMLFVKSLDSSVPITLTNDATIGINPGAVFTQREAINSVPKRSAAQPALTVAGGGTLVLTNSELGSLDELTVDADTTVKIDNPGDTTNIHLATIKLHNGALEVGAGTTLDPGYGNDELPTTVAIEGDGRVILRGALLLDAYTTEKETGMDKLDFTGFDGDITLANPLNLTVHLNNASDFLGQIVTLDWLIDDNPEELYNIDNVNLTLLNDEGISFIYWLNADGTLTFGDHNAIPEPSTWALLILGAAGLLYWRKRNRKA
ncbi:MAG: PEP-CTERM sorting domain-containing protein [Thermoguttaceae bacterium]|nr:PEP-CTERM sorting domain-containing protein [Thermoguttaceae bacterium]